VARAAKPASSKTRALATSHTFGKSRRRGPRCIERKASALLFCFSLPVISMKTAKSGNQKSRNYLDSRFHSRPRIEVVTQRVADEVEGEHGEHHRRRWK